MREQARRVFWIGSLGRRVLAAFLVVSLVPLLLTAMLSYRQTAGLMEAFLQENVAKTARSYASDLDLFLERRRFILRSIPTTVGDTAEILRSVVEGDPNVEALWVMNAEGTLSAKSGEVVPWAHDACSALLGNPDQAMTHAGAGHAHAVIVAVPIEEGVLCGQVSFTLHQDMLTSRATSITGGTAYIVDRSGTVVCHAFEDHEPHISRGQTLLGPAVDVASLAVAWTGTSTSEEGDTFASFAPSKSLPWGVWVEVPREQAIAPLRVTLAWIVGTAGGLALLSLFLAVVLVRRLVAPIEDVVAAVKGITLGNLGASVPVRGEDEVAELAQEFNRMSTALQRSYAELDQRVAERTAQLIHQEKMASVGTLAAGLAHEIGNPLASMSSELEMLERMWDPEEARSSLPVLRDQVRRISLLLRELVEFGRPVNEEAGQVSAQTLVQDVVRLVQHDPRAREVKLRVTTEGVDEVWLNRDRVVQVLVNLGLNALDALEGEGTVLFAAKSAPGGGSCFEVTDDGPGMSAEITRQVFDPFFTTKPPGKGTGLGLFVSEQIVEGFGGHIDIQSKVGGGTTVSVTLPGPRGPTEPNP